MERGGKRNGEIWDTWDCKKEDAERNPRKLRNISLVIPHSSWRRLAWTVPAIFQARGQLRLVGLEQEAAGPRQQVVVAVAAAAVAEGGTCH